MRNTALSQKLSRTAYIYVSRGKDLLQIEGLEVKRRETFQKLRLVSLNHRWAATRSSANTHTATKQMAAFISLRGRSKHLACQLTPGRSLQFQFRTSCWRVEFRGRGMGWGVSFAICSDILFYSRNDPLQSVRKKKKLQNGQFKLNRPGHTK